MNLMPVRSAKTIAIRDQSNLTGADEWTMAAVYLLTREVTRINCLLQAFITGNGNAGTVRKVANQLLTPLQSRAWLCDWKFFSLPDNAVTITKDSREEF